VVLTINHALQEITERALGDAVARMGADGGDIVVLDPHDGSILAMASKRTDPRSTAATALSEPFEPGSTLKPFIAASLIEHRRASETDTVDTYGGQLTLHGRTITDVHKGARMSLREVIQHSSNVGIVQFASRLTNREQFETLRDFGFGNPTGVPYPSEAAGRLTTPARWSKQSPASLAMGYELAVTPLQLASAYAAFANGGELLAPALVKEIVAPDGSVKYRHQRTVVRRVVSAATANRMRDMLEEVVSSGTALQADLSAFALAGKTGTARRTIGGRYARGQYYATFVGLFPAERPQYVILVKLDSPRGGTYYGGTTAAPVTKAVLEAAIAARDAALDRGLLAAARSQRPDSTPRADGSATVVLAGSPATDEQGRAGFLVPAEGASASARRKAPPREDPRTRTTSAAFVFTLPAPATESGRSSAAPRPIPDVRGLELRDAVRALHEAGFRIQLSRGAAGTSPAAGTLARPGSLVRLNSDL
jgi:cell division protein FtsI (penicillin-binding protein 3)